MIYNRLMKRAAVFATLFLFIFGLSLNAGAKSKRVLAIGNSFSADAVENHLWELAAESGDTLIIGNAYIGGCTVDRHLNNLKDDKANYSYRKIEDGKLVTTENITLKNIITDEPWDVISLQQGSPLSGKSSSYNNLPQLIKGVKELMPNKKAEIVWHNTWAYACDFKSDNFKYYGYDQNAMLDSIISVVKTVIPQNGIKRVIPSGIAIQNARETFGDVLNRDGYHLALPLGRYVAACTWYEFLTGKDVTKLRYKPAELSEEVAAAARSAAHDVKFALSLRPTENERAFISEGVEKEIERVKALITDPKLAWMFENCFPNTLDTTVKFGKDDNGNYDTFVVTGDIPAMWLRDSGAQVWPYVALANDDAELKHLIEGVIRRQINCILLDPYANAFNEGPTGSYWESDYTEMIPEIHERKWEIDSLCYPIRLAYEYWKVTGDDSIFDASWVEAVKKILATFSDQQRKDGTTPYRFQRKTERASDTLINDGLGAPVKPCGLIVSSFRPSDDATTLQFLIPSNFFAVTSLRKAAEILSYVNKEKTLADDCLALAAEVENAIKEYAVYNHPEFGQIYAFEVDGFGNHLLMDDANVPSLLAMPYLGDVDVNDPIYQNTRRFVWSDSNPYFFKGKAGEGIGGPHIGYGMAWPMSIMMKAFTSTDPEEVDECISMLLSTDNGTGFIHESFDVNDPSHFTRPWFAWQNTLFGELILKVAASGKSKFFKR